MRLLQETIMFGKRKILPFWSLSLYDKVEEQFKGMKNSHEMYNIHGIEIHPSSDLTSIIDLVNY